MDLKYKVSDTIKLLVIFSQISNKKDSPEELFAEIKALTKYPAVIIEEFLKSVDVCENVLKEKGEEYFKENPQGILGYITMRINLIINKK